MATGEIKWLGAGKNLGYVPVKPRLLRTRDLMERVNVIRLEENGSLDEIELIKHAHFPFGWKMAEAAVYQGGSFVLGESLTSELGEISGDWRWFISLPKADGSASREVEAKHISEAFDLPSLGITPSAIGLEQPISEYGVHVVPLHLGKGLVASIYVNVATSTEQAQLQQSDFLNKGAEVSFLIETHYPYLEKPKQSKAELSTEADEAEFWLKANIKSLSVEAKEISKRLPNSATYVADICSRIT